MVVKFVLVLVFASLVAGEKARYDNYSLHKITPQNEEQVAFLKKLQAEGDLDFWKAPSMPNEFVSVVSPPEMRKKLEHSLKKRSIKSELMMENIQEAFDSHNMVRSKRNANRQIYWNGYQTIEDIHAWFEGLAETYPDVVTVHTVGSSFQGRNITGIRISRGSGRRAFFLEAGSVGADWLSPAVVTYIADQLISGVDDEARQASEDFDWYIFPVSNPDGYEYTQEEVRLWYKNRRPQAGNQIGVDTNRNWNSQWGVAGGSHTPSANNYVGLGPFSEPETRSLSAFIETIGENLAGFFSFRQFGQRLVIPFAHTTQPMYNYDEMVTVGRRAMGALAVRYGTQYTVGTSQDVSDGATGNIVDWAKYRFNPPLAATYLLRDDGSYGYIIPPTQVLPTAEETLDSVLAMIREARNLDVL